MSGWTLSDLPKATGKRNTPGMGSKIYFLPIEELDEIAAPPTWAKPGDSILIDGGITVKTPASQGFRELYVTPRTAQLIMDMVGQIDSKSMDLKHNFERPGFDPGFLELLLESPDGIIAVPMADCEGGQMVIIGAPCNPANIEGNYDSGKMGEADGKNGWTGVVTYMGTDIRLLDAVDNPLPMLPPPGGGGGGG